MIASHSHTDRSRLVIVLLLTTTLFLSGWVAGCGGGLKMTVINSDWKKPNNVWVFFTVMKGEEPIANLTAKDFKIYEDDGLVSAYESKQTIQNPDVAAVMYTLLLLDVSGSMTESGQINPLVDAAIKFTERVGKTQKVGVYAFDGAAKIHAIVPFSQGQATVQGGLEGLRKYKAKDPSTNLHGAVVEALQTLRKGLNKEKKPLKFGTLVVFSDGADRAARVSKKEMASELAKKDYEQFEVFAIGIGDEAELEGAALDDIGRDGTEIGNDPAKVSTAFEKIAGRIEAHTKRFYLLSYCSPARSGKHKVRIALSLEEGGSGDVEYSFDAAGFGPPPQCNPSRAPTFKLDVDAPPAKGPKPKKKKR